MHDTSPWQSWKMWCQNCSSMVKRESEAKSTRKRYQFCIHYIHILLQTIVKQGHSLQIYVHVLMSNMVHIAFYKNSGKYQLRMSRCSPMASSKCIAIKPCGKNTKKEIAVSVAGQIPWNPHEPPKEKKATAKASSFSFAANVLIWSVGENIWPIIRCPLCKATSTKNESLWFTVITSRVVARIPMFGASIQSANLSSIQASSWRRCFSAA